MQNMFFNWFYPKSVGDGKIQTKKVKVCHREVLTQTFSWDFAVFNTFWAGNFKKQGVPRIICGRGFYLGLSAEGVALWRGVEWVCT